MPYIDEHPEEPLRGSSGCQHSNSVVQLQRKLDLTRIVRSIACSSDFAEVRIGNVSRAANCYYAVSAEVRCIEVRVIGNVIELRPELHRESFGELEVLE